MKTDWPPPYYIRQSLKAKRINLRICPERGLELVVPASASEQEAISFLNSKRNWVEKHQNIFLKAHKQKTHPQQISLEALQKTWTIRYEAMENYRRIKLLTLPNELVLLGPIHDVHLCIKQLKTWLSILAEKYLLLWLRQLSQRCQLPFNQLTIRGQKTRWGSCSSDKNINLNYKLLFFPYHLIEYVIIHELCHTVHLNHSKRFWRLVEKHCCSYQNARAELRQIDRFIPDWV